MRGWFLAAIAAAVLVASCKHCEDECREFVELSFASGAPSGAFASTRYDVVVDGGGEAVSCSFDVEARTASCDGDADGHVDDGSGGGESGTGGFDDGRTRLVLRWYRTPESLDVAVRDAASALVVSNTLEPAYQEQGVRACDAECRSFNRELMIPAM